jgi:hypothetical protein
LDLARLVILFYLFIEVSRVLDYGKELALLLLVDAGDSFLGDLPIEYAMPLMLFKQFILLELEFVDCEEDGGNGGLGLAPEGGRPGRAVEHCLMRIA